MRITLTRLLFVSPLLMAASPALTFAESLPIRATSIPQTTDRVPHVQIDVEAIPVFSGALLDHVAQFPGVRVGATRVSLPGALGSSSTKMYLSLVRT